MNALKCAYLRGNTTFPELLVTPALLDKFKCGDLEEVLAHVLRVSNKVHVIESALKVLDYPTMNFEKEPGLLFLVAKYATFGNFQWFTEKYKVTGRLMTYTGVLHALREYFERNYYDRGLVFRVVAMIKYSEGTEADENAEDSILAAIRCVCQYGKLSDLQKIAEMVGLTRAMVKRKVLEYVRAAGAGDDETLKWFLTTFY